MGEIIQKGISGSPYNWGKKDLAHLKPKSPKKTKVNIVRRVKGAASKMKTSALLTEARKDDIKIIIGGVRVRSCSVSSLESKKMDWSMHIRTYLYSHMHKTKEMKYTPSTGRIVFVKEPTPELEEELTKALQPGISKRVVMDEIRRKWKPMKISHEKNTLAPRIYKSCFLCQLTLGKDVTMGASYIRRHEKKYHGSKYLDFEQIRYSAWYPVTKILLPK